MISKQKVIYFLVAVVAVLLVINVILGLSEKKVNAKINSELSVIEVEENFYSTLDGFGIHKSWIKKRKFRDSEFDSIDYKLNVSVPIEVSIPVILKDLSENFMDSNLKLTSSEVKEHGSTKFNIKSGNTVKLSAEFKYNSEIKREYCGVAFFITDYIESSELNQKSLFDIAIPVGIVLPLSESSRETAEMIKSKKFKYFVELSDESNDLDIDLSENSSLENLNSSLKRIISLFNSPDIFLVDKINSGFNQATLNFLEEKFQQRGRKIVFTNNIFKLSGESVDDLKSLLDFHLSKINFGETKIFRISLDDYLLIQDEIRTFLKRGNKIGFPSHLL